MKNPPAPQPDPFASLCPNLSAWSRDGWFAVGRDDFSRSFVRVLDTGGLIWEGDSTFATVHDALRAADGVIAACRGENG